MNHVTPLRQPLLVGTVATVDAITSPAFATSPPPGDGAGGEAVNAGEGLGGEGAKEAAGTGVDAKSAPIPRWQELVLVLGGITLVVVLPMILLVYMPHHSSGGELDSVPLSLGCMLLVGWLFGRASDFVLGLPPLLGYMAFGFLYRSIEGDPMTAARPYVLKLAFILVLIRAGLEIHPRDLTLFTVALGTLPLFCDVWAAAYTASAVYGLDALQAATFGAIVCALGDGIVIPRMIELCLRAEPGRSALARNVLTAAPIECTTALFLYGTLSELLAARPLPSEAALFEANPPPSWPPQILLMLVRLLGTLVVSAVLAHVFALLLGSRRRLVLASGRRLFNGTQQEELVIVLAAAFLAFGASAVLPMPERFRPPKMRQALGIALDGLKSAGLNASLAFAPPSAPPSPPLPVAGDFYDGVVGYADPLLYDPLLYENPAAHTTSTAHNLFAPFLEPPSSSPSLPPSFPSSSFPPSFPSASSSFPAPHAGGAVEALVEADLAVVATIFFLARLRPAHTVHRVEESVAALWQVAALFLFVSLGSNLVLPSLPSKRNEGDAEGLFSDSPLALLLPILAGLAARACCNFLLVTTSARSRGHTSPTLKGCLTEAAFVCAATLPRATIQGVLGGLPLQNGLVPQRVGELVQQAAAATVLLLAPLGVVVQELCCEPLLRAIPLPDRRPSPLDSAADVWRWSHPTDPEQGDKVGGWVSSFLRAVTTRHALYGSDERAPGPLTDLLSHVALAVNGGGGAGEEAESGSGELGLGGGDGVPAQSESTSLGLLAAIAEAEAEAERSAYVVEQQQPRLSMLYADGPTLPAVGASLSHTLIQRRHQLARAKTVPSLL